jgi:hypothetical protein
MPTIPEEYPVELTDEELVKLITEYSIAATVAGRPSNYSVGPSYWKEMVDLGQSELSNRVQKNLLLEIGNLKNEIRLLKEDNEKSGRINKRLNYITIGLAVITGIVGYMSLRLAEPEKYNGKTIPTVQLSEFKRMNRTLDSIAHKLNDINTSQKVDTVK